MKVLSALLAAVFVVAAAAPSAVAPIVADEGYYIQSGADATAAVVGRAVSDARSAGSRFYAVVLAEEPGAGATFYAESILDRLPDQTGTVLVVAPETVGWAKNLDDVWTTGQLDDALDVSLDGSTSDDVVRIFVVELVDAQSGGSGVGGGLWIVLLILAVIIGGFAFLAWRGSRSRKRNAAEQLLGLKAKAQTQVDAIANDILDDEDEVAEANDPEATRHFEAATSTYSDASARLDRASTAKEVVDIAADLDEAIWHLDAAEAILDKKPVPSKPERPTVPEPTPPPTTPDQRSSAPASGSQGMSPPSTYRRRDTRRSGFGAGDMLETVLAMQAMRTLSGGWGSRRSSSTGSSHRRSSTGTRSSGRSRGGGRRRR